MGNNCGDLCNSKEKARQNLWLLGAYLWAQFSLVQRLTKVPGGVHGDNRDLQCVVGFQVRCPL